MPTHSSGAHFIKADLHTHSPASTDYKDKSISPKDIVANALAKGLGILGITDHNSAGWVESIRQAAKGTDLCIIPGVEVTTPEGHFLALFECEKPASEITDMLVKLGMPRESHGKEEAITSSHAEDVIREIVAQGGLAIAAHANESSGLLKEKGQYKIKTVAMPELSALELSKKDEIERFCQGKVSSDYKRKACTRGSDAHALSEVAARATWFKMDMPSLRGIRQALMDYELRVRFEWDIKLSQHPRILSLQVNQGFFDGVTFSFHESLNCIVGGKGTGKSTVVELLRFCFGDSSSIESVLDDHQTKLAKLVGEGGVVSCKYLDSDGVTKVIQRTVDEDSEREVRDEAGGKARIETEPVFFSQGELVAIAHSLGAQLELIDRYVDVGEEDRREGELQEKLRQNAHAIIEAEMKVSAIMAEMDDPEKGKVATEARQKALDQKLKDPLLKSFQLWEAEQKYLSRLEASLDDVENSFGVVVDEIDLDTLDEDPPAGAPNAAVLKPVASLRAEIEKAVKSAMLQFRKAVSDAKEKVKAASKKLEGPYAATKKEHTKVVQGLGGMDERQANARFTALGKRLTELGVMAQDKVKKERVLTDLLSKRKNLRNELAQVRRKRWERRAEKADALSGGLKGLVSVTISEGADRRDLAEAIRSVSRQGRLPESDVRSLADKCAPSRVVELILEENADALSSEGGISKDVAKRLLEAAGKKERSEVFEIDCVQIVDKPEIAYTLPGGKEKPLNELSTGGKGTVIISLAMVEGNGPLVIDQPEEPLDTQSIYGQVVKTLRQSKEGRQFLLTTHNPNVAVGADAELTHILEATADQGRIESSGGVDHAKTNRLLLEHLEGGEEALMLRVRKYELA